MMVFRMAETESEDQEAVSSGEADKEALLKVITGTLGIKNMKKDEFIKCERIGENIEETQNTPIHPK